MIDSNRWVIGSLFSGIGGFSLAARWMGWETAFQAELEPYASRTLAKNFPGVPNLGDVRSIDGKTLPLIDVLAGGFPCQDISLAGKGAGITGERSGLWKEYARLIGELRPRYVLAENVSALRSRGLAVVLSDLSALGYDAEWHCIPASAVGAPHQRDRIWIIAYPEGSVDNTICAGLEGQSGDGTVCSWGPHAVGSTPETGLLRGGESGACDRSWWATEPAVGRVAYGIPNRVDRLRCLGNSLVPTIPFQIFRAIRAVDARPSMRWEWHQLAG